MRYAVRVRFGRPAQDARRSSQCSWRCGRRAPAASSGRAFRRCGSRDGRRWRGVHTGSQREGRRQRDPACQRSASLPGPGTIRRAATARDHEDYCHGSCSCSCRSKARRGSCRLDIGFASGTTNYVGVETNRGGADIKTPTLGAISGEWLRCPTFSSSTTTTISCRC